MKNSITDADLIAEARAALKEAMVPAAYTKRDWWVRDYGTRLLDALEAAQPRERGNPPETIYKAVERVLDENSAWIARPNAEVTRKVAMAAGIAWSLHAPASPPPSEGVRL